ncbi:DUF3833 family protein [Chachezhania sediminis]|uniref:DUF3833 family protein n=1 Tax=Chachezhania sediminis TaxID=2599291 RepID=UPI00131AF7B4|nr:DUF3833 family protein [Chachezhania sediminis]
MMVAVWMALGAALVLALLWARRRWLGFAAQRPADYAGVEGPALDLRQHLDGPILCDGAIFGPTGRISTRFTGTFHATWDGNRGRMTEHFQYDSGTTQDREWTLLLEDDGSVRALAPDVIGTGRGQLAGPTLQLCYRLKLPEGGGGHVINVTDWMYLAPNGHLVNRSQFFMFGLKVGELVATLRPAPAA